MSHAGGDAGYNQAGGRGRGVGRGRPGRGRGRGRGSFRFPVAKSSESDYVKPPETTASQAPPDGDGKPKPTKKQGGRSRGSTHSTAPESIVDATSAPRREKELPPHIAGAAVDAESLVSRVRELAINGHAHTSSMESRFTMSLNWADEEDDPDSLPDLDDWAVKPKVPPPEPEKIQELPQDVHTSEISTVQEAPPVVTKVSPKVTKDESIQIPPQHNESSTVTKKARKGLESSIWATPETPTSNPAAERVKPPRQAGGRGSASSTRLTDLPFHPLNVARASEPNDHVTTRSDDRRNRPESKTSPRKPHARPVISTDAISRLSRSLGRDSLRQQQPATTTT